MKNLVLNLIGKFNNNLNLSILTFFILLFSWSSLLSAQGLVNKDPTDVDLTRRLGAVGTGPYFGIGSTYDGTDLVVLQPLIHKDLGLLKQNQRIAKFTGERSGPKSPYVQLSGVVSAQTTIENMAKSSIDLTNSNLDIAAWVNTWITAYTNFGVKTEELNDKSFRMILGFITVGNLDYLPLYMSIGQMFVPFGSLVNLKQD